MCNNSWLIDDAKQNKYKKGLCLTEKLMCLNPLLFLYQTVEFAKCAYIQICI